MHPLRAFNRQVNVDPGRGAAVRTLLEAGASAAAGSALTDQLMELLELECARAPMFLAVEDLQWSDLTTLIWLRGVMQHVSELPLLVVLTTRPPVPGTDVHRALAALAMPQLDLRLDRRRAEIGDYLDRMQARQRRALNIAIVAGAAASVLTASAAVGGQRFANWLASGLGLSLPAWQVLCAVATLFSLAAAITTQLLKSHNVDERVARAQTARAKLDIVRFGLATGHLTEADAAAEYRASVELSSFITSRM